MRSSSLPAVFCCAASSAALNSSTVATQCVAPNAARQHSSASTAQRPRLANIDRPSSRTRAQTGAAVGFVHLGLESTLPSLAQEFRRAEADLPVLPRERSAATEHGSGSHRQ